MNVLYAAGGEGGAAGDSMMQLIFVLCPPSWLNGKNSFWLFWRLYPSSMFMRPFL